MANVVKITVTSDLACPWCYLGRAFLNLALDQARRDFPNTKFEIHWRAYMIDPRTNENGEDYLAYNERRWGSDGWTYELRAKSKQYSSVAFGNWKTWPNTFNAHRVLRWARETAGAEAEDELLDILLRMCYEEGENISLGATCVRAVEKMGKLNVQGAKEVFEKKLFVNEVAQEDALAKQRQTIHGVPYFVVAAGGSSREVVLKGCNPPERWAGLFQQIAHK
jgi:predicted DsbA family dithiol-disulfide isomerase